MIRRLDEHPDFEGAPVMLAGDPRVVKGLLRELEVELGAEGAALAGAQ